MRRVGGREVAGPPRVFSGTGSGTGSGTEWGGAKEGERGAVRTRMPYRDDGDATRERIDALRRELDEIGRTMRGAEALDARRRELARALDDAERDLGRARRHVALPLFATIRIASPCRERWEDMRGDERARHCARCDKTVFDLSALTRDEAEALLAEKGASMCARFYRRADGTVMTADCDVGARARRRGWALAAGVALAAGAGAIGLGVTSVAMGAIETGPSDGGCALRPPAGVDDDPGAMVMGEVAFDPGVATTANQNGDDGEGDAPR